MQQTTPSAHSAPAATAAAARASSIGSPGAADPASQDWQAVRALYPAAAGCTYLNTASHGLLSAAARSAGEDYYRVLYENPNAGLGNHWMALLERARADVARFIGAEPESVAFVPNASAGMNLGADLIAEPGEVVAHAGEFPSVTLPWEQRGHAVRLIDPAPDGSVEVATFGEAVGPNTRYLCVSAVQYASGYRVDLAALRTLCDAHDLYLLVDATQAVGAVPVDVRTCRPDVLMFSSYKWACAGYGVAALYVSPELRAAKPAPAVGWRSAANPYGLANHRAEIVRDAYALEMGNPIMPGPLVLAASLAGLASIGVAAIAERVATLTDRLRDGARTLGIPVCSPVAADRRSAITMLEVPDAEGAEQRLRERGVHTSARAGRIRVAPHLYNNEHDIDALLEALERP